MNIDHPRRNSFDVTHSAANFAEIGDGVGDRLRRAFWITSTGPGWTLHLSFSPILGFSLSADGDGAELPYRRAAELLRERRRWFASLLFVPVWFPGALLLTVIATLGRPTDWSFWMLLAFVVALIGGRAKWSPGGLSQIYLTRRHEQRNRWIKDVRNLRGRLARGIDHVVGFSGSKPKL